MSGYKDPDFQDRRALAQAAAAAKAEADAVPAPTEAELKAARDAKYAARKKRKKG